MNYGRVILALCLVEFLVDVWESRKLMITHVLAPSLTSRGWDLGPDGNGRNDRSGKLSHSGDEICACICFNVDLHVCVWLRTLWVP